MKKNVLLFGAIVGALLTLIMFYTVNLCYSNPEFESNDILGYVTFVLIFSVAFFGIRNYRNRRPGGEITFARAFATGTLISLVASTIYVVIWLFYYYLFVPDFLDHYIAHVMYKAQSAGATSEELLALKTEMAEFKEMYKSPFFVVVISYFEVLPIGILVSLISALILKRKPKTTLGTPVAE